MEFFNVYDNLCFSAFPYIMDRLTKIEPEKRTVDACSKVFCGAFGIAVETRYQLYSEKYISDFFQLTDNGTCIQHLDIAELPIVLSKHEKEFIHLMLQDKEACAFLSEPLHKKLLSNLGNYDTSSIRENYLECFAKKSEIDTAKLRKVLSVLIKAIQSGTKIAYTYENSEGKLFNSTCSPYKLSYSLRDRILRLIACPDSSPERFILMNLERFKSIFPCAEEATIDAEQFYQSQKRKLIINVNVDMDNRNRIERCLRLFSSYQRVTEYHKDEHLFKIVVDFYRFEKNEIIKDIFSMGSSIIVLSVLKHDSGNDEWVTDDDLDIRGMVVAEMKKQYESMLTV